jgi:hypothetical protein
MSNRETTQTRPYGLKHVSFLIRLDMCSFGGVPKRRRASSARAALPSQPASFAIKARANIPKTIAGSVLAKCAEAIVPVLQPRRLDAAEKSSVKPDQKRHMSERSEFVSIPGLALDFSGTRRRRAASRGVAAAPARSPAPEEQRTKP